MLILMIALLVASAAHAETLRGVVRTREGRPAPGARVAASPFARNLDTLFASTNGQGEYSFDLPAGDYVVYVDAAGHEMAIEAGAPGRALDFRLEPVTQPELSESYIVSARTTEKSLLDRQYGEIEAYYDRLIGEADARRAERWRRDFSSVDSYLKSVEPRRRRFVEILGGFPAERTPLEPRRELFGSNDLYRSERVWLQAAPGVEVYGVLLIPKRAGRRPALVCQHGMGGSPAMTGGLTERDDYLRRFGAQAAERGYVVFAPYLVNDAAQRSRLHRKAQSIGQTLQGLEQWKHMRVVDFLQTLPEVDPARIGIYGISWGGRTALYASAIDTRYAAVVVSGYFNQNAKKLFEYSPYSTAYVDTPEEYAFFPNFVSEFSDADLASLVAPRPLFIEAGTLDTAAYFKDGYIEFTRSRDIYRRLAAHERIEFGLFRGLHLIHGIQAFRFLDRWLKP